MAAGFLERMGGDRFDVRSAGTEPAETVNPAVIEAMAEREIDLAGRSPTKLLDETVREASVVVTMGCGDACPVYPGKRYEDWELVDPAGKPLEDVREVRDEIEERVRALIESLS